MSLFVKTVAKGFKERILLTINNLAKKKWLLIMNNVLP